MTTDRETEIAAIVRNIVTDYALDTESLHASWRCEHPDVYGPCGCVDEFVTSSVAVLAAYITDREAEAWDAGFNDGAHYASADLSHATYSAPPPDNPFRFTPDTEGQTSDE